MDHEARRRTVTSATANAIWPKVAAVPQPAPNSFATSVATANALASTASWRDHVLAERSRAPRPGAFAGVSDRGERLVFAEYLFHRSADLAKRAVGVNGLDDRGHQVFVALGGTLERCQSLLDGA